MPFFDELQSRLLKAGDAAAQKTKEITETSRLRASISQEQQAIQSAYSQIGQIYYSKYGQNPDSDLANLCHRIDEAISRIQSCDEQIKAIKNEVECSNCHTRLPKGTTFCSQCGSRLDYDGTAYENPIQNQPSEPAQASAQPDMFCPNCGNRNPAGRRFCSECGTKLTEE